MATISVDMVPKLEGVQWRAADVEECLAAGLSIQSAVEYSMNNSTDVNAVSFNGKLVAVWGYRAAPLGNEACAWLLSTVEVEQWKYRFARSSYRIVVDLLRRYPRVSAYVYSKHEQALEWLTWLGFKERSRDKDFIDMVVDREGALWAL